jgi:NAD(P)-dependent dehydrogenase (short-subunit alcohol dehydrogenase family)
MLQIAMGQPDARERAPCHLTEPADCQALVQLALSTFGGIDVLFNLAAISYFN